MKAIEAQLPQLLNVKEVAAILKVSVRTVKRHVTKGIFPRPIEFGRNVRWDIADVESFIETHKANLQRSNAKRRGRT
jgi:prophage regulatory protein